MAAGLQTATVAVREGVHSSGKENTARGHESVAVDPDWTQQQPLRWCQNFINVKFTFTRLANNQRTTMRLNEICELREISL